MSNNVLISKEFICRSVILATVVKLSKPGLSFQTPRYFSPIGTLPYPGLKTRTGSRETTYLGNHHVPEPMIF